MTSEIWDDIPKVSHWAFITTQNIEVIVNGRKINKTIIVYKGYVFKAELLAAIKAWGNHRPYEVFRVDPAEITLDITVNVT